MLGVFNEIVISIGKGNGELLALLDDVLLLFYMDNRDHP